jgi:universal stress protein E
VTLADVVEALPQDVRTQAVAARVSALRERFAHDFLTRLAEPLQARVPTVVAVWRGTPFVVVTQRVLEEGFDLVVRLAARDRHEAPDADDMHLVRKCPCPIWLVNMARDREYRNIAVAVDRDIFESGGAASSFAMDLARAALRIARIEGAHLHVLHAWEPFGADLLDDPALGVDAAALEAYIDGQRDNHKRWLAGLNRELLGAPPAAGSSVSTHLLDGRPEQAIPAFLEVLDADLLVMGTVGITTVPGMFIGNTAERILQASALPVLALKPPGFVSPMAAATA